MPTVLSLIAGCCSVEHLPGANWQSADFGIGLMPSQGFGHAPLKARGLGAVSQHSSLQMTAAFDIVNSRYPLEMVKSATLSRVRSRGYHQPSLQQTRNPTIR